MSKTWNTNQEVQFVEASVADDTNYQPHYWLLSDTPKYDTRPKVTRLAKFADFSDAVRSGEQLLSTWYWSAGIPSSHAEYKRIWDTYGVTTSTYSDGDSKAPSAKVIIRDTIRDMLKDAGCDVYFTNVFDDVLRAVGYIGHQTTTAPEIVARIVAAFPPRQRKPETKPACWECGGEIGDNGVCRRCGENQSDNWLS